MTESTVGRADREAGSASKWWLSPRFWLAILIGGFFLVSLYSGIAAYANLQTQNATDAGIITQAVASTSHGQLPSFYEAYDCGVKDRCSFLIVHPAFVLYLAVPFFSLAPTTVTLMGLRAAVVAAGGVPLFWLTRRVTGSAGKGLLAVGLYFVWTPNVLGDAFSLHIESLLPLELFSLAALWEARRYRLGLLAAGVAFLSFEIFPIFTFLVGVFFLAPYGYRWAGRFVRRVRERPPGGERWRRAISRAWTEFVGGFRILEIQYTIALLVASLAAYVVLSSFENLWGSAVLGVAAPRVPAGLAGLFYDNSSEPIHSLGSILSSSQTVSTAEYWLILYALVAFLPLLSPRALTLSVPWIGWTFLEDSNRYATIGHQYSFLAAGPIFIGLAYGLRRVPLTRSAASAVPSNGAGDLRADPRGESRAKWRSKFRAVPTPWLGVVGLVVVANALLLPVTPLLPSWGITLGAPFSQGYFDHSLSITPSYPYIEQLVASIPYDATVAAAYTIFPIIANLPHAYPLTAARLDLSRLPFDTVGAPQFVLFTPSTYSFLGATLGPDVLDPQLYRISGYVAATPAGALLLYEKGYTGLPELYGAPPAWIGSSLTPGDGLRAGPWGVEASDPHSPSGAVIQSTHKGSQTGQFWEGPDSLLVPGSYEMQSVIEMSGPNLTAHPGLTAIKISLTGFGVAPINVSYAAGDFSPGAWQTVLFNFTTSEPIPNFEVNGLLANAEFSAAVASVSFFTTSD